MKFLTLTLLGLFAVFNSYAQSCSRSGSITNASSYANISGDISLVKVADTVWIKLESNFTTTSAPDLDVYIGNAENSVQNAIKIEPLKSFTGEQLYKLPLGTNVNDYNVVTIHCTQYNSLFGYALMTTGDCEFTTSSTEIVKNQLVISTNNNLITWQQENTNQNSQFTLFNISGNLIATATGSNGNFFAPNTGIYILQEFTNGKVTNHKIVVN